MTSTRVAVRTSALPRSTIVEIKWPRDGETAPSIVREIALAGAIQHVQNMVLSTRHKVLCVGTSDKHKPGCVRIYKYPLDEKSASDGGFQKVVPHSLPITAMRLSVDQEFLMTVSEDGSVAVIRLNPDKALTKKEKEALVPFSADVLVTKSDIEETNAVMAQVCRF